MPNRISKSLSKHSSETLDSKPSKKSAGNSEKSVPNIVRPKKVILSKRLPTSTFPDGKSCSTGSIKQTRGTDKARPKKTAKSDANFCQNTKYSTKDCFTTCGDTTRNPERRASELKSKPMRTCKTKPVQEYYMNENFRESIHDLEDKLGTIQELPEQKLSTEEDTIRFYTTESDEQIGFIDPNDIDVIKSIKDFRDSNYFECHSSKARVQSKGSVTSLENHKCVFRFYLNERLFPVPLTSDHKNNARCVECNLPYTADSEEGMSGTIQAKVTMDDELTDMTMFLPVRKPLIIQERRKDKMRPKDEVMYFGVINLKEDFGKNCFSSDSLALRHQKGYRKFENDSFRYQDVAKDNVVII